MQRTNVRRAVQALAPVEQRLALENVLDIAVGRLL